MPTQSGALVCNVYQGTPAYKAGVRPGDVITGVSGQSVSTATGLTGVMLKYKPGATVSLTWVDTQQAEPHLVADAGRWAGEVGGLARAIGPDAFGWGT